VTSEERKKNSAKGGRNGSRKGIPNKNTNAIRKALTEIIAGELEADRLTTALTSLYNKDKERYIYAIVALGKQVLPAMMALKVEDETKKEEIKEIVVVKAEEAQLIETKK